MNDTSDFDARKQPHMDAIDNTPESDWTPEFLAEHLRALSRIAAEKAEAIRAGEHPPTDRVELIGWAQARVETAERHFVEAWQQHIRGDEFYDVAVVFAAWTDVVRILSFNDSPEALVTLKSQARIAADVIGHEGEYEAYGEAVETVEAMVRQLGGGS